MRVPAFYTYDGFYLALLGSLPTIAESLRKEKWLLGPAADNTAVNQEYSSLFPEVLDLYANDFVAAWNAALGSLQLRPMLSDKPKYLRLSAASAPTSPIRQIFEWVRNETALTRERKKPPENAAVKQAGTAVRPAQNSHQSRPCARTPGASIETTMEPFQNLVDGDTGARPIDALLANLDKLWRDLTLAAENRTQAKAALQQADQDVATLRANVTRLPSPLAGWMERVAEDAASDATTSSIAQLAELDGGKCHRTVPANHWRPISVFLELSRCPAGGFRPPIRTQRDHRSIFLYEHRSAGRFNGSSMDLATQHESDRKLSDTTLRRFQQAVDIRDAFFPTGGSFPNINLEAKLLSLNQTAQTSTLLVNGGSLVVSRRSNLNQASLLQWPGTSASAASITLSPDLPDQKSSIERVGPWALFRLIDSGRFSSHMATRSASFSSSVAAMSPTSLASQL